MDLSIIIVNWNSKECLQKCLLSIFATPHDIKFEVLVIDSASFDGCGQMVQQCYPQVRFIQSERNLGFARANNEASKISRGNNLLFLNPDTEIEIDTMQTLLCELVSLPHVGIVGPKLLNSDRTVQMSCIRTFPTILNQVLDVEVLRRNFPRSRLWGMAPLFARSDMAAEVDAVSGACLMIKRSVFESVGRFSADYFMYSEDIDICLKVRTAGWKVCYIPSAVVIHHGGASSAKNRVNTFSSVMMLESRWRFFRKTRTVWYAWVYRLAMFSVSLIRVGLVLCLWPVLSIRGRATSAEAALKKWIARLRWTLGREKWVKNY